MASPTNSGLTGGSGGNSFDDTAGNIIGVTSITIHHGNQVDGIQATYLRTDNSTFEGPYHGGNGGSPTTINFAADEVIVEVYGKTNNVLVDQITFVTRKRDGSTQTYGPYGMTGETPFSVKGRVASLFGRSGNLLDAIGFTFYPL
ncbi:hypothetical protein EMCRGX_G005845 [Ephydatia muelleri]|eukprot:Em0007g1353a